MIGNPNWLSAHNFDVAVMGISKVVDEFHRIGTTVDKSDPVQASTSVPDGNTLLNMFGEWLFEACTKPAPEFEDGKYRAYAILCGIFSQPQRRNPFLRTYLERFYTALSEGLKGDSYSLTSIILNSSDLLALPLDGLRIIVPDLVISLRRVLPRLEWGYRLPPTVQIDDLRRSAL
ncbi:hypothetical protein HK102_009301, partial [Quaeritorhiza haematococci]